MNPTPGQDAITEYRRAKIASIILRKPRITQRQIVTALSDPDNGDPLFNPETGREFSVATVCRDIKAIKREWRKQRNEDVDGFLAVELAKIDEAEAAAWNEDPPNQAALVALFRHRSKLLGLEYGKRPKLPPAPASVPPVDADEQSNLDETLEAMSLDELRALVNGDTIPE